MNIDPTVSTGEQFYLLHYRYFLHVKNELTVTGEILNKVQLYMGLTIPSMNIPGIGISL